MNNLKKEFSAEDMVYEMQARLMYKQAVQFSIGLFQTMQAVKTMCPKETLDSITESCMKAIKNLSEKKNA